MKLEPPGSDKAPTPGALERLLMTYVREPLLHPVLAVVLLHVVAVMTPAVLMGLRDRSGLGLALLFLMVVGSGALIRNDVTGYRGRPGPVSWVLLGLWGAAFALAGVADNYGLY